jgi:alpha-beta hydrolase superfamily lysophospholipase
MDMNRPSSDLLAPAGAVLSHGQGHFTVGGHSLFWQAKSPVSALASLVIVHGVGEHQQRYEEVVSQLVESGIAVYTFDQRGHGRSTGARGHIDAWSEYVQDLLGFLNFVQQLEGERPLFVFGHSMGALVALDAVLQVQKSGQPSIHGLVLNGIPLRPGNVANPMLVRVAKLLSWLRPQHALTLGIPLDGLSSKPEVLEAYLKDPLVQRKVTARWGVSILAAIDRLRAEAVNLNIPTLVTHGLEDSINLPAGSQELMAVIPHRDKTIKVYPRSRHEVHNDVDASDFLADIANWILPRSGT